jgi:hypothetical protein
LALDCCDGYYIIFIIHRRFRAHSFGQFKKHALLKACTQSPCFSYTGPAQAFKSAGLVDLSGLGGDCVGWLLDLCSHRNIQKSPKYTQLRDVLAMNAWFK